MGAIAVAWACAEMDRFRFRPFGLNGCAVRVAAWLSMRQAAGHLELVRDGQAQALHSKFSNMPLRKGDVVRLVTSGGGLGSPGERQASSRRRDREQGYSVE